MSNQFSLEGSHSFSTKDDGLQQFLQDWDKQYLTGIRRISLFDETKTNFWNQKQKEFFVKTFYHVRGHFFDFLWYMGNHAPDLHSKKIILDNIAEEFGGKGKSHEQLYLNFAKGLCIDLSAEIAKGETYLPFIRKFNQTHIEWLRVNSWVSCLSAFSAYERLDNIDYLNLYKIAKSLGSAGKNRDFFTAHIHVQHFSATLTELVKIWIQSPDIVKKAYNFISGHQISMWKNLSQFILNNA